MLNDLLFLINLGFLAVIILLIPYINPEALKKDTQPPIEGNVLIQVDWQKGKACDVDTWVQFGDERPVGYSNKGSEVLTFALLRDDLGNSMDENNINSEFLSSQGVPDGDYTINVHMYNNPACPYPVAVHVEVGYKVEKQSPYIPLFFRDVELLYRGHEVTVARWTMNDKKLVPGSEHDTPIALRSQGGN
jgi:hypothetical protein